MSFLSKLLEVSRWRDHSFPLCCCVTKGEEKLCPYQNKKRVARTFKERRDISYVIATVYLDGLIVLHHYDHSSFDMTAELKTLNANRNESKPCNS